MNNNRLQKEGIILLAFIPLDQWVIERNRTTSFEILQTWLWLSEQMFYCCLALIFICSFLYTSSFKQCSFLICSWQSKRLRQSVTEGNRNRHACSSAVCSGSHVYILLSLDSKLGLTITWLSLTRAIWAGCNAALESVRIYIQRNTNTTHIMFIHTFTDVNKVDMLKLINRIPLYNVLNLKITV